MWSKTEHPGRLGGAKRLTPFLLGETWGACTRCSSDLNHFISSWCLNESCCCCERKAETVWASVWWKWEDRERQRDRQTEVERSCVSISLSQMKSYTSKTSTKYNCNLQVFLLVKVWSAQAVILIKSCPTGRHFEEDGGTTKCRFHDFGNIPLHGYVWKTTLMSVKTF